MRYYEKSILESNSFEDLRKALEYKHSNFISTQKHYTTNNLGFRDTEIFRNTDVCYYGCSITYGLGVDTDDRWTNIVDKLLEFKSNNFGVPGASTEDIAHLFIATSKLVSMKMAVFLLPDTLRSTLPVNHENDYRYIKTYANYDRVYEKGTNEYKLCDTYYRVPDIVHSDKTRSYIEIIRNWAQVKNIKIVMASWAYETCGLLNNIKLDNMARVENQMNLDSKGSDSIHPGIESHKNLAYDIIKVINNELQGTV